MLSGRSLCVIFECPLSDRWVISDSSLTILWVLWMLSDSLSVPRVCAELPWAALIIVLKWFGASFVTLHWCWAEWGVKYSAKICIQEPIFSKLPFSQTSIIWKRGSLGESNSGYGIMLPGVRHVPGREREHPSCLEDTRNPKSYIGISPAQSTLFSSNNCETRNL